MYILKFFVSIDLLPDYDIPRLKFSSQSSVLEAPITVENITIKIQALSLEYRGEVLPVLIPENSNLHFKSVVINSEMQQFSSPIRFLASGELCVIGSEWPDS
jgi:hypothetical protein